ncbi:molybdopterin molybdotransferase MoeA [Peribacillus glennii]|uniref:Molybdopterin molybdenumtransferase n=1 Tax=Peribacillus glennii TaxID=2303991 RepID=A0A372LFV0_9BACI|nr:gephyrin-like molybdotransferase Glp [Peribacillus glennii]RFU65160.1 molybdopterin molybdenumtransferase MoeA [Peribacillus glennii]
MLTVRKVIEVDKALNKVLEHTKLGDVEYVSIEESDGRYLAIPLQADHDVPPFDRSPVDGFAIHTADTRDVSPDNPVELEVIEEIGAGIVATREIKAGQAIRIMTGAKTPKGADAVVMLELTKEISRDNKRYVVINQPSKSGDNITFKGDDTQRGTLLIEKGRRVDPGVKALLATFGYAKVPVIKKPVVGIYATGTELLEVHEQLQPGKIRNSNSHMLISQIKKVGAEPKNFGNLEDDFERCFEAVSKALEIVDVLITTGGVSVGDYDFLPEIYEKLGANVLFNKISMRPGSVTTVAEFNGKLLFGLSGNPSACFVGFELFVRPWLKTYFGSANPHLQKIKAILDSDFLVPNSFTRFVRGRVSFENGRLLVSSSGVDKSSNVTVLANSDVLIILPGGEGAYKKGTIIEILLLD